MIPFRKITLADAPTIASYFEGEERERAIKVIKSFAKSGTNDMTMAIVDGMLVLRQEASQLYVYSMPVGKGNLRLVLMQMMESAAVMGYDWLIVGIRHEEMETLRTALPQHFKFSRKGERWTVSIAGFFFRWRITASTCGKALKVQTWVFSKPWSLKT